MMCRCINTNIWLLPFATHHSLLIVMTMPERDLGFPVSYHNHCWLFYIAYSTPATRNS